MLKIKIVQVHYGLLNGLLSLIQQLLFQKVQTNEKNTIKKILIFRNGSFGDTVCALPTINSIRKNFPDAKIAIMTNSGGKNLVSIENIIGRSLINEFINYLEADKKILAKKIKEKKYDLFIELPQDQATFLSQIRNMIIIRFIFKIHHAFGWEVGATRLFKKEQEKYFTFKDERKRLLDILEKNNLTSSNQEFLLNITEKDTHVATELIKENNLSEKSKNIAFVLGAKRLSNRWPIEYFKEVAMHFSKKGFNIIVIGGKEDQVLARQLLNITNTYDFTGILTPMQSAVMLKNCRQTLSNDTGPMHLSYAVETPIVAVFSSRDYPNKWFPPKGSIVLRNNDIECSVCFTEICTDNQCMKSISTETVISSVENLLQISENNV
jgi:ADP-heptose:LPS heptosyltransferase